MHDDASYDVRVGQGGLSDSSVPKSITPGMFRKYHRSHELIRNVVLSEIASPMDKLQVDDRCSESVLSAER